MIDCRPTVLLTGASGVLGRALIEHLSDDFTLLGLQHRTPIGDSRVREIAGADVLRGDLGLDRGVRRALRREVDVVLHCAAETNWNLPPADIFRRNVGGTTHLQAFAASADATFYHVSTAFVARPPWQQSVKAGDGVTAYIESKIECEELVRRRPEASVIVRPSVITGDSQSGQIARHQGLHKVMAALMSGTVPLIPADPTALVDCLPQDLVARAIGTLLRRRIESGEFWLTAGEQALRVSEAVGLSLEAAARAGLPVSAPRHMPVEAVDRLLIPLLDGLLDRRLRRSIASFVELLVVFQSQAALPSSMAELGLAAECERERLLASLRRAADACAAGQVRANTARRAAA
jgi:thioester reductase-like protein